ncbi:MAG: hypothetical protein WBQ32_05775 [Ignavibacteriaceae bacterium]
MSNESELIKDKEESPPPFLGRWRNVYGLVLVNLTLLVLLFYIFTKVFE